MKKVQKTNKRSKHEVKTRNCEFKVSYEPPALVLCVCFFILKTFILKRFRTQSRDIILSRTRVKKDNLKKASCYMAVSLVINNFVKLIIIRNDLLYHEN